MGVSVSSAFSKLSHRVHGGISAASVLSLFRARRSQRHYAPNPFVTPTEQVCYGCGNSAIQRAAAGFASPAIAGFVDAELDLPDNRIPPSA